MFLANNQGSKVPERNLGWSRERFQGKSFAVPNSRRNNARMYVLCMSAACTVTVEATGTYKMEYKLGVNQNQIINVDSHKGSDKSLYVKSDQNMVLAIADNSAVDYIPVPPEARPRPKATA